MPKFPKITGYSLDKLDSVFRAALNKYLQNGAVKKVGEIESANIKTRGTEDPVHLSEYNKNDTNKILSVQIKPLGGGAAKTHHIYADGTGTLKKGDKREFSTSAGKRE